MRQNPICSETGDRQSHFAGERQTGGRGLHFRDHPVLDLINYFSKKSRRMLRARRVRIGIPLLKTKKAFVANEPLGVVGIISPWNYPLLLPLGQIIPALLVGNSESSSRRNTLRSLARQFRNCFGMREFREMFSILFKALERSELL